MLSAQPWLAKNDQRLLQQSASHVRLVCQCFPGVRSKHVRVCMAAWLGTVCAIDDMLEEMQVDDAESAILNSIAILKGKAQGCGAPLFEMSPGVDRFGEIQHFVCAFDKHCKKYLSSDTLTKFFQEVCNVFDGFLQELKFKAGHLPRNLDTYMAIRRLTIATSPAFELIKSEWQAPAYHCNDCLLDLQNDINLALGLQNDLLGFERDLENGESMNAVTIALENDAYEDGKCAKEVLSKAIARVCNIYDSCLSRVRQKRQKLLQSAVGDKSRSIVDAEYAFLETHLKFLLSTERYQTHKI